MKKNTFKAILSLSCFAALLLWCGSATAVPIDLGFWDNPPGGDDAANELAFLNETVLPAYNAANDPDLATATFGTENNNTPSGPLSITLTLGAYDYLKLKWDNKFQYYCIAGMTGDYTFDSTVFNENGQPQALSHYTYFSPNDGDQPPGVPEGGWTVSLLGLGLAGLGMLRRKIS